MSGIVAKLKQNLIGDRAFYKAVTTLIFPLVIQQGIANLVNLLDNVMVGGLGTESLSGVGIVNQLTFVIYFTLFGAQSGASIFGAQYAGMKDNNGIKYTLRYKLISGLLLSTIAYIILLIFGETLVKFFLDETANSAASIEMTLSEAMDYFYIAILCFFPFIISQSIASTLRDNGDTVLPMQASLLSFFTNFVLNYVMIYGHFGFPKLGVKGAAIATVIARVAETVFLIVQVYRKKEKHPYIEGTFRSLYIPGAIVKKISLTGLPLLLNEFFWSLGMALINQNYSYRGIETIAAMNITATVSSVFAVIMYSMGSAIAIMIGQQLGAGDIEGAKKTNSKLIFLSFTIHVTIGLIIVALSGVIPNIYKVAPQVRELTSSLLVVAGLVLPLNSLVHAIYFTIRTGGKTIITFLFDCVFTWTVSVPLVYVLCHFTALPIVAVYTCVQLSVMIKIIVGLPIVISGKWARNIVYDIEATAL